MIENTPTPYQDIYSEIKETQEAVPSVQIVN